MEYEYLPIEQAKKGDIVEYIFDGDKQRLKNTLAIIGYKDKFGSPAIPLEEKYWRLVKTKPGREAEVGDTVIRVSEPTSNTGISIGQVFEVKSKDDRYFNIGFISIYECTNFLTLCLKQELKNYNIMCDSMEESTKVQELCFSLGLTWFNLNKDVQLCKKFSINYEDKRLYSNKDINYKTITGKEFLELHNKPTLIHQECKETSTELSGTINPKQKEQTMQKLDLKLLLEFLTQPKASDATSAKHIGVLTEANGDYVGYVYADSVEELEDVVRKLENEGRKLHVFNYSTTLAQKPRKIIQVERV